MQDMTNSTNWSSSTCLFLLLLAYQKQCPSPTPFLTSCCPFFILDIQNSLQRLLNMHVRTAKLTKPCTPKILLECYCVANAN